MKSARDFESLAPKKKRFGSLNGREKHCVQCTIGSRNFRSKALSDISKTFRGQCALCTVKKREMAAMISRIHCKKSLADSFSQLLVLSTKLQLACLAAAFGRYLPLPHHLFFSTMGKTFNAQNDSRTMTQRLTRSKNVSRSRLEGQQILRLMIHQTYPDLNYETVGEWQKETKQKSHFTFSDEPG